MRSAKACTAAVALLAMVVAATCVHGDTIRVPGDWPTIQEAIDNASAGDRVFVSAGTYKEDIVLKKRVDVIGEYPDGVVLHGTGVSTATVTIPADAGSLNFEGFTVTGAEIGIDVKARRVAIRRNIVVGNAAAGITCSNTASVMICNNDLLGNGERGINIAGPTDARIVNNIISGNEIGIDGRSGKPHKLEIDYNNVWKNFDKNYAGCKPGEYNFSEDPLFRRSIRQVHLFRVNSSITDATDMVRGPDGLIYAARRFRPRVAWSADNGFTWTESNKIPGAEKATAVSVEPDGTLWAGAETRTYPYGGCYKSEDHGKTWRLATEGVIECLLAASNGYIFAGGYAYIHRSTDGGETWDRTPLWPFNAETANWLVGDSEGGIYCATEVEGATLMKSEDGGDSWFDSNVPGSGEDMISCCIDRDDVVYAATCQIATVWKSLDGGKNWVDMNWPWPVEKDWIYAIAKCDDGSVVIAVGEEWYMHEYRLSLYATADEGETWTKIAGGIKIEPQLNNNLLSLGYRLLFSTPSGISSFLSPRDWHLSDESPCIDAGDPTVRDPDGSRSDIGALPFNSVSTEATEIKREY